MWERIKKFFKDSETIFWARIQTITGFVVAALSSIDWTLISNSAYSATGLDWKQGLILGLALFLNGMFTEYLRRRRDPDLK